MRTVAVCPAMALAPESFVGVNAPAHIAALEALYAVVNPDKLAQVPIMWEKFGASIWQALAPKYPNVRPPSGGPALPHLPAVPLCRSLLPRRRAPPSRPPRARVALLPG